MALAGKVFIITGASKGIGRATAERVARDGASVVLNYLSDTRSADEVVKTIGSDRALAVQADASKLADIDKIVEAAMQKFGRIDVIMPCAGVMGMHELDSMTEEIYNRHFDINVKGPMFLVQKAARHMKPGGRVILVSTGVTTLTGVVPSYLPYCATKGAVDQMTRLMAKDLGRKGITVNAVAPGPTATDLFLNGKSEEMISMAKRLSPFNDLGRPEDSANLVAFLASDDAKWISGQTIRVNGANMV